MTSRIIAFAAGISLLFSACDKEDDMTTVSPNEVVKVAISPNFEGEDVELNQEFINHSDYRVAFSNLRFYIGDFNLIKSDGTTQVLSEIELFDEVSGEMVKSYTVPNGDYTGFTYSWGVPERFSGTDDEDFDPNIYEAGHPLNIENGMYWSWNSGYRYMMVEGRYDTDPNGTDALVSAFSYHPGTQTLYLSFDVDMPITLDGEGETKINLDLDLSRIFYDDTQEIDCADPQESSLAGGNTNTLGVKYISLFEGAVSHSLN